MKKIREEITNTFKIILPNNFSDPKSLILSSKAIKALESLRIKYGSKK